MAKKKNPGKNRRKRRKDKRAAPPTLPPSMSWMDKEPVLSLSKDGLHALLPGEPPSAEVMTVFNENFRKELRNSPLWNEMVEKFGAEEAEELLKQVQIEAKR